MLVCRRCGKEIFENEIDRFSTEKQLCWECEKKEMYVMKYYFPLEWSGGSATVGLTRKTVSEMISIFRKYAGNVSYHKFWFWEGKKKLEEFEYPKEGRNFRYDRDYMEKYVFSFFDEDVDMEIWIPSKTAPLIVNFLDLDMRLLIAPVRMK